MKTTKWFLPAVPPEDYKGKQSSWIMALVSRGLFDEASDDWYGDIMISKETYIEILEECEG